MFSTLCNSNYFYPLTVGEKTVFMNVNKRHVGKNFFIIIQLYKSCCKNNMRMITQGHSHFLVLGIKHVQAAFELLNKKKKYLYIKTKIKHFEALQSTHMVCSVVKCVLRLCQLPNEKPVSISIQLRLLKVRGCARQLVAGHSQFFTRLLQLHLCVRKQLLNLQWVENT